jgi:hypothetical protein
MLKYRAVRTPHQHLWSIEVFDTEVQVAYDFNINSSTKRSFLSKEEAESFIKVIIGTEKEVGEWFDGPI